MTPAVHRLYIISLIVIGIGTFLAAAISGFRYYNTSPEERGNIIADYEAGISDLDVELELMKEGLGTRGMTEDEIRAERSRLEQKAAYWRDWGATGFFGHGLGIAGSLMMIFGVALYSTRKRVRRFRFTGRIKHFLEFHMFLCLLGPALVILHSTFKFGGIVSVSLWSMVFVALSGIFGRYLYTQLPKTSDGDELSLGELTRENEVLRMQLRTRFHLDDDILEMIDHVSSMQYAEGNRSVVRTFLDLAKDSLTRRGRMRAVERRLRDEGIPHEQTTHVLGVVRKKATLLKRIAFFDTARALFQYWHVIHIPFSIIMFLILAVHVILTVSLGYTWIF
jgi:hypothetical protein